MLQYMEYTTPDNAVNDTLKELQEMVEQVKRDGEVSLSYMKGFERDTLMYEKGAEKKEKTQKENADGRILPKRQGRKPRRSDGKSRNALGLRRRGLLRRLRSWKPD